MTQRRVFDEIDDPRKVVLLDGKRFKDTTQFCQEVISMLSIEPIIDPSLQVVTELFHGGINSKNCVFDYHESIRVIWLNYGYSQKTLHDKTLRLIHNIIVSNRCIDLTIVDRELPKIEMNSILMQSALRSSLHPSSRLSQSV